MSETEPRWSWEFLPFFCGAAGSSPSPFGLLRLRIDLARLQRAVALDVGDEQPLAVGRQPHRAGIPAGRDQPRDCARPRGAAGGLGGTSRPRRTTATQLLVPLATYSVRAVRAEGDGVGAAAERELRLRPAVDGLDHLVRRRVDDADRVAVGVGDVDELAVRARGHAARVAADRDRSSSASTRRRPSPRRETLPWFATLVRGSVFTGVPEVLCCGSSFAGRSPPQLET